MTCKEGFESQSKTDSNKSNFTFLCICNDNEQMTVYSRTPAYDRIHFVMMAMESGAHKLGITPQEMLRRLEKQDLIRRRLLRHYDILHTQSLDYVANDIVDTLQNWEKEAGK